jgi:hypothetical protein
MTRHLYTCMRFACGHRRRRDEDLCDCCAGLGLCPAGSQEPSRVGPGFRLPPSPGPACPPGVESAGRFPLDAGEVARWRRKIRAARAAGRLGSIADLVRVLGEAT